MKSYNILRLMSKKVTLRSYNYFFNFLNFEFLKKMLSTIMSKLHSFCLKITMNFRNQTYFLKLKRQEDPLQHPSFGCQGVCLIQHLIHEMIVLELAPDA